MQLHHLQYPGYAHGFQITFHYNINDYIRKESRIFPSFASSSPAFWRILSRQIVCISLPKLFERMKLRQEMEKCIYLLQMSTYYLRDRFLYSIFKWFDASCDQNWFHERICQVNFNAKVFNYIGFISKVQTFYSV